MSSMSLWSGRTLYTKHTDARGRDLFVPQGHTTDDSVYCWRVKQDPTSGKFFFVNSAGLLDKRWRLPDIHDERFVGEVTARLASSSSPRGGLARPTAGHGANSSNAVSGKSTPSRNVSVVTSPGGTGGADGTYDALVASSPALYVASPYHYQPPSSRGGSSEQPPPSGGTPPPPPLPGNPAGNANPTDAASDGSAFVYDDADWHALQVKREQVAALRRRDDAMRLQQAVEAHEMGRGVGPGGHPATAVPVPGGSSPVPAAAAGSASHRHLSGGGGGRTPYDVFVDYNETAHRNAVQRELIKRRSEHDDRQRAVHDELAALEAEERQLQEQASREEHRIRRLEDAQLQALRRRDGSTRSNGPDASNHDNHVNNATGTYPNHGGGSSYDDAPSSAAGGMLHVPSTTHHHHYQRFNNGPSTPVPSVDPYASASAHHHGSNTTASSSDAQQQVHQLTAVIQTLQKLLEHERQNNEKLQSQLEDKERIAMEQLASEAEREQREIAMRIRMLEAIAAHRREVQLVEEEQRARASSTEESLRSQLFRGTTDRYVPEHPLLDKGDF